MGQVRIRIDLNARTSDGLAYARITDVEGHISVGDVVEVYEPEDTVAGDGIIQRIDSTGGFVEIAVDWTSLRDDGWSDDEFRAKLASHAAARPGAQG